MATADLNAQDNLSVRIQIPQTLHETPIIAVADRIRT
jgi:hypothetical protein